MLELVIKYWEEPSNLGSQITQMHLSMAQVAQQD